MFKLFKTAAKSAIRYIGFENAVTACITVISCRITSSQVIKLFISLHFVWYCLPLVMLNITTASKFDCNMEKCHVRFLI